MAKTRIYEIAKDIEENSKEILAILAQHGFELKNHMSTMEDLELDIIFDYYTQKYDTGEDLETFLHPEQTGEQIASVDAAVLAEPMELPPPQEIKPIKPRIVDTRPTVVDMDKLDTEKIEKLITVNIREDVTNKQKIKKTPQRQQGTKKETKKPLFEHHQKDRPKKKVEKITVKVPDEITVGELAALLKKTAAEVIKPLMNLGIMASVSQTIDYDSAALVGEELGFNIEREIVVTTEDRLFEETTYSDEDLTTRPPVVVVMGHVDHGKTSLLDAIRETNVTKGEAGGITQHIGAYTVKVGGKTVAFLDTPGHEAFTAMRARGAQVTDIAILVVASDDGIKPQTIEAINHAKLAEVSIIVAINKIDKPESNPDRIKQQLTEHGLVVEEWGGDIICVEVSAKEDKNIDHLLDMVLLVAEMKELRANPKRRAMGTVIESRLDKGRGPIASMLVQDGTLNSGDVIVAGTSVGRVRVMTDDNGRRIDSAGPSMPVEVTGLSEAPAAGDSFRAVTDERMARELVEERKQKAKDELNEPLRAVSLEDLFEQIKLGEVKDLNIIVKADVQGSVEALRQSLEKLSNDEVRVRVIHGAVGAINESDVILASTSNAIIIGFNVRPDVGARATADFNGVDMRMYRVIYEAIDEVSTAMKGLLAPKYKVAELGQAEIRQTFRVSGIGVIGGCYVQNGKVVRNAQVRVVRDGIVVHEGVLDSLKRFKDDAKEVAQGYECGIGIEKFNDIKENDILEFFIMQEIKA